MAPASGVEKWKTPGVSNLSTPDDEGRQSPNKTQPPLSRENSPQCPPSTSSLPAASSATAHCRATVTGLVGQHLVPSCRSCATRTALCIRCRRVAQSLCIHHATSDCASVECKVARCTVSATAKNGTIRGCRPSGRCAANRAARHLTSAHGCRCGQPASAAAVPLRHRYRAAATRPPAHIDVRPASLRRRVHYYYAPATPAACARAIGRRRRAVAARGVD